MTQIATPTSTPTNGRMTHGEILEALSGLLIGMFMAILSGTVVSNALPRIIAELRGSQSSYTWVVTAALLATTATTPIWGKLADLTSKKLLVQIALGVFLVGSVLAGLSQTAGELIAFRVVQGAGAGGLMALSQVILAVIISPRERGRYMGYLGAVMAVGTIGGPLIGGVIVDTSWLGWRWCFYIGVPFAVLAILVLQKTLHLPHTTRQVKIDYAGALVIVAAVSLLLVWVTFAGNRFAWASWQTALMVGAAVVLTALAAVIESRAAEPIIPLQLFRLRTVTLATVASVCVGVAMFGATIFLSLYLQISRGQSPTKAGLMTLPMVGGLLFSSVVIGRVITRTGRWKRYLVAGSILMTIGFALMTTLDAHTELVRLWIYMAVIGLGIGMVMQNLVLAVQNTVDPRQLGAGSSVIAFFRTLGGAIGVSTLGAVLADQVKSNLTAALAKLGPAAAAAASRDSDSGRMPDLRHLPAPFRLIVEGAYGDAIGEVFAIVVPFALLAVIAILFIKEVPLRQRAAIDMTEDDLPGGEDKRLAVAGTS